MKLFIYLVLHYIVDIRRNQNTFVQLFQQLLCCQIVDSDIQYFY